MAQFLTQDFDLTTIKAAGMIYKNVSQGPVKIDSDGTMAYVNQVFMIDKSNSHIDKQIARKNLILIKSFVSEKSEAKKEEVPQTVAQTDKKTSVQ